MSTLATLVVLGIGGQGLSGGGGLPVQMECMSEAERREAKRLLAEYERTSTQVPLAGPRRFTFYPLAGNLYRDLFTTNFVDLDPTSGILDWDCTGYTYDGHDATDVLLRTFGEQTIGVPVFAALDGTVIAVHDGEEDMHTSCAGIANYVMVDHGGGRICYYLHLRNGSVQVAPTQVVRAGEQIGLAASSGCSTYPHLHFATYDGGNLLEPFAGPCRAGPSAWTAQPPMERGLYAQDFNITDVNISTYPGLPHDMPRTGTFVQGVRPFRFWVNLPNLPANSTWRIRFVRPDQSTMFDSHTNMFGNASLFRWSWWWWSYGANLNVPGTWHLLLSVNGTPVVDAPFDVVATTAEIVNRAPYPIEIVFDPPEPGPLDVVSCRVSTDLVLDDPDYEIVRYHYVWSVDGMVVRDVTTAAQSDVVPRLTAPAGSLLECAVTATDGVASAPTVVRSARVKLYPAMSRWR